MKGMGEFTETFMQIISSRFSNITLVSVFHFDIEELFSIVHSEYGNVPRSHRMVTVWEDIFSL